MFYSFVGSSLLVCQMYNSINEKRTPSKNCYAWFRSIYATYLTAAKLAQNPLK